MFSLIPQCIDRVKAGSFAGRIDAEEETDPDSKGKGDEDRQYLNGGLEFTKAANELRERNAERDADYAADDSDDHGLNHELHENV